VQDLLSFQSKRSDSKEWQEFPWEQIMVKTNVIKKWHMVDMQAIRDLHNNFNIDTAKFHNLEDTPQ
jgi:hypothetical protein